MSAKDIIHNTKKVFQNGTAKEIVDHLWYYYKWYFLIFLIVAGLAADLIYTRITAKEFVLQGMFLNVLAEQNVSDELKQDYLSRYPINTGTQDIYLDTALYFPSDQNDSNTSAAYDAIQIITAKIISGQTDFIVADAESLNYLAYEGYYADLSDVLTDIQFAEYRPLFLYYDRAYAQQLKNINLYDTAVNYPDPTKPELMEDPVPVMIDVSKSEALSKVYLNSGNVYAFAFIANANDPEHAVSFVDYLMDR